MSSNQRHRVPVGRSLGWRRRLRKAVRSVWFSLAILVEANAEAAAFAEAVDVFLELGDDGAKAGDLSCQRAVDDRGQRRDDGGECEQHH